jgi:uncharacterized protein YjdB
MLIPLVAPFDALAEDSNNTLTPIENIVSDQTIDSDVQTILPNDSEVETLTEALLPSIISQEEVQQNQYIGRVRAEEENLNTLVFKNADGTNTMRIFNHPVKYVDTDGTVKDISLKLESTSNGFQPAAHNIATTFANQLSDGIRMRYEDIDLLLIPVMQSSSSATQTAPMALASLSTNRETVSYPFGVNTTLEYTLTYTGYKEDIVVSQYTGQTEYNFLLQTDGLIPEMDTEGGWILKDSDGNPRASLGDIIIFTADERNNTLGRLTVETIKANQIYLLTIHVDSDWLSDPDTVYPIRIDPAMDVINTSDGSNAIEDLTLNSNAGSSMTSKSLSVGKRESYGISRILMRFPGLDLSRYNSADQIISVTVGLRDILCESTPLDVYCHAYNEAWVSSPSWTTQNPNNYDSTVLSQKSVSYAAGLAQPTAHRYQFDITAAVKNWKNNPATKDYGILFKASPDVENGTTYNAKTMASFNRTSNQPNLTVTYVTSIQVHADDIYLYEGETLALSAITLPSDANVTWISSDESIATVDNHGVVTGYKAGSVTITGKINENTFSSIGLYVLKDDGAYYLNNYGSQYYLHVENGGISDHNKVYLLTKYSQQSHDKYKTRQMWRICHIDYGRYTIRPMHKLSMGLNVTNGDVDIIHIGTTDTIRSVSNTALWTIQWTSTGYVFRNCSNTELTLQLENTTAIAGGYATVAPYSNASKCVWSLESITNPPEGVFFYNTVTEEVVENPTKYVAPGESRTLSDMNLEVVSYCGDNIDQTITWSRISENGSKIAYLDQNGTVQGVSYNTIIIQAKSNASGKSAQYTLNVTGIANGTYYLRNRQSGHYTDIKGPTMAVGTTIHQWQYHGGNSQRWIFIHQGDGYYSIQSAYSSTPYYLSVKNDSSEQNTDVVLSTQCVTAGTKWKVEVSDTRGLKLIPKSGEANGYVLATTTSDGTNGAKLIQGAYVVNTSYRDEWCAGTQKIYMATVNCYFDNGFNVRFSQNSETSVNNIDEYIESVSEVYRELLGLHLYYNTAQYYDSPLDQCETHITSTTKETECSCGNSHDSEVLQDLFEERYTIGNSVTINVLWSGHKIILYYKYPNGSKTSFENRSFSSPDTSTVFMLKTSRSNITGTLFHELNHQFGANDHYHNVYKNEEDEDVCVNGDICSTCSRNKRPAECIMNNSNQLINTNGIICSGCQADILDHLESHH